MMPRRDGTGPEGKGPGTGRRRGGCFSAFYNKQGKFSIWRSFIVPAIGFIINDARKPDGITQRTVRTITKHFKEKNKKLEDKKKKEVQNAEYEVLDEKEGD